MQNFEKTFANIEREIERAAREAERDIGDRRARSRHAYRFARIAMTVGTAVGRVERVEYHEIADYVRSRAQRCMDVIERNLSVLVRGPIP